MDLTHFDQDGNAWMVDVSDKDITTRTAVAEGFITINDAIYERIAAGTIKKGDVLSVAQLAAIMGAKQTSNLIPLCHPLALTKVEVHCILVDGESPACTDATHNRAVKVHATVKTTGKTGVEMEALTAVQVGLLTVYDMCKAIDKGMIIGPTYLVEKEGGKSGHFVRSFVE
ncbi:MAG: cyclic pyranopterin monophosphate synthase MoaC [Veillonella parvula]|uniref:cyclic pyranopterin monophosphate synthase MoaC n=1 Tax=Veillonella parvula TaxID=29466 RepID=UPI00290AC565|nr:cyclic pyranopterin monophosphate synthase MoaC [Veillonella parvula]MDU4966963.1 cyclic pyranopterin monophosphate synthase MoaC [Veillonella parvula]